jgi:hypothetical protein
MAPLARSLRRGGVGVAVVSEPLQRIPAKNVIFRDLAPEDRAWVPVGAERARESGSLRLCTVPEDPLS